MTSPAHLTAEDVLAQLDRAHRMGCSDPDDPTKQTLYSLARDALAAAHAERDQLRTAVEALVESAVQRSYMEIAVRECLTVMTVPGDVSRAIVPPHWREQAEAEAVVSLADLRAALSP